MENWKSFNVQIGSTVILNNPDVERWLDSKKTEIDWAYYDAYKGLLQNQERPAKVIRENEKIIDSILDLSGDPTTEGKWARKGLVDGKCPIRKNPKLHRFNKQGC